MITQRNALGHDVADIFCGLMREIDAQQKTLFNNLINNKTTLVAEK
jgi:hypothetical protein